MSAQPSPLSSPLLPRKPPTIEQFNWLTNKFESAAPRQLAFDWNAPASAPAEEETFLPKDDTVTLLATESGSQLLVSGFGLYLGKKGERVVVKQGKTVCAQAPMMRLQEIVVGSRGVSFSSDLIEELCSRGIRLACLNSSGKPYALITSPLLTATVETRRCQLVATTNETGAEIARWLVAGKIRNQEKLLRYFAKSRGESARHELEGAAQALRRLRQQALEVKGVAPDEVRGVLMGLEGTAGRMYWQQIARLLPEDAGFDGREHRGAPDGVNAALNYGYGILQAHVWGAVMNAGLEPFAGVLHVDRSGKPSLVLDLMEEFRQPVVDRAILGWLNKGGVLRLERGLLDGPSRENVASRVLLRLNTTEQHRGKKHEIRSVIQMQARLAASAVRRHREYRPFSFRW